MMTHVAVHISMTLIKVVAINEEGNSMELQFQITLEWKSHREEGWGRVGDGCYQHSSPGPCNHTQLVLQSDMPEYCQCTNHLSCPSFMSDLSTLSTFTRHSTQYMAGVARLQAMVCSKPLQQVCCPDNQILAGNFQKGARKKRRFSWITLALLL